MSHPASSSSSSTTNTINTTENTSTTSTVKDATFAQLKDYEMGRRLAYSAKLDSMSLYWKSYRDLLAAALQETGRAQRIVVGTCRAFQVYASAMKAMNEDVFLDERGNVANEKQQKRLATIRNNNKKSNNATTAITTSSSFDDTSNTTTTTATTATTPLSNLSAVSEIKNAQELVASKFTEMAQGMNDEIADAIGSLMEETKAQCQKMEELGSCVLAELERTETEVSTAWGKYLTKASTVSTLSPEAAPTTTTSTSVPNGSGTDASDGDETDLWLVETQYRVGVAYQNAAWETARHQLEDLFQTVKRDEIVRRMNLREFLVAFVQRQERLFLSLPTIHNSVLEELVGKEQTRKDLEVSVQEAIDRQVAKYQQQQQQQGGGGGAMAASGNMGLGTMPSTILDSPLNSDLLSKAKLVERRGGIAGIGGSASSASSSSSSNDWKLSLAVLTADNYLHFFDLESGERSSESYSNTGNTNLEDGQQQQQQQQYSRRPHKALTMSSTPEAAFGALIPQVTVPTWDNVQMGKTNFSKGWSDSLTPTDSVVLAKCTLQTLSDTSFLLTEKGGGATAASKMFGKLVDRKFQLRTPSKGETDDWIAVLTA